ncbi:hypothetical protein PbJCM13498_10050 [Prolixibacter bellariivorans]|uniref:Uncharacterized protein n=1 Tax=Prolixibacter bellariivorans TaxID=314319 RepID=A0A5M4AW39_9BACT|nr:hypothetical protein PbJCM13498_10050 [Prolixibacter bellariivorans]
MHSKNMNTNWRKNKPVCLKLFKGCLYGDGPFYLADYLWRNTRQSVHSCFRGKDFTDITVLHYKKEGNNFPTGKGGGQ